MRLDPFSVDKTKNIDNENIFLVTEFKLKNIMMM